MRRHRTRILLVFALLLTSCKGCQKSTTASLVDLAAADARVVVIIPDLVTAMKDVGAFATSATKHAGKEALEGARKSFSDQLGFDPFTPNGFAVSGLEPTRGLVLFTEGASEQGVIGAHVADRGKLGTWLKGLLERSSGASKIEPQTRDGLGFFLASRPFGSDSVPVLYWGFAGNDVLLCGPEALESFVLALKRNTARTPGAPLLSADPAYIALSAKVPPGDMRVFARGAQKVPAPGTGGDADAVSAEAHSAGIAGSLTVGASGARLEAFVDFPVKGLAQALDGEGPLPLATRVEDDAVIVALTRIAKPDGLAALRNSPLTKTGIERSLERFTSATQLDAEKDLAPLLRGPVTVGVHIMDLSDLPAMLARHASTAALLEFVHVSVTAEVASHDQMVALLDKSQGLVEAHGNKVTKRVKNIAGKDATIYEPVSVGTPSIGWGVIDNYYVYGAGQGRLERAIAQVVAATADKSVAPRLAGTVAADLGKTRGSFLVVARAAALADNVAKLQSSKDTMILAVMPMVSQAIEVLRTIGDVAADAKFADDGVHVEARETLR